MKHGKAALGVAQKQTAYVHIRPQRGHHLLPGAQQLDRLDAVAVLRRRLEAQLLGGALHLLTQLLLHGGKIALQQLHRLSDALPVGLLSHLRTAPAVAVAQMVIEAGALFSDVPGKLLFAGGQMQCQRYGIQNLICIAPGTIGAEIAGPVLRRAPYHRKAGIAGIQIQADIGIAFVILQQNIIFWLVPLDERTLQHQRLKLAVGQNDVKVVDLADHGPGLFRVAGQFQKILADPVAQCLGLAHIDHRVAGVHHNVDAGMQRQRVSLVF